MYCDVENMDFIINNLSAFQATTSNEDIWQGEFFNQNSLYKFAFRPGDTVLNVNKSKALFKN